MAEHEERIAGKYTTREEAMELLIAAESRIRCACGAVGTPEDLQATGSRETRCGGTGRLRWEVQGVRGCTCDERGTADCPGCDDCNNDTDQGGRSVSDTIHERVPEAARREIYELFWGESDVDPRDWPEELDRIVERHGGPWPVERDEAEEVLVEQHKRMVIQLGDVLGYSATQWMTLVLLHLRFTP